MRCIILIDDHGDGHRKKLNSSTVGYTLRIDLVVLVVARMATKYILLVKVVSLSVVLLHRFLYSLPNRYLSLAFFVEVLFLLSLRASQLKPPDLELSYINEIKSIYSQCERPSYGYNGADIAVMF